MVETLVDKPQRHHLDPQPFGEHPMRLEAGPHTVAGPQQRLRIALGGPPQRIAFAFERQRVVHLRGIEPGGFDPLPVQPGLGLALRDAEGRRHEGLVHHEPAVGGEAHVGKSRLRLRGVDIGVRFENLDQGIPLPHRVGLRRLPDVAGHPGVDDVLDAEVSRRADQQSCHGFVTSVRVESSILRGRRRADCSATRYIRKLKSLTRNKLRLLPGSQRRSPPGEFAQRILGRPLAVDSDAAKRSRLTRARANVVLGSQSVGATIRHKCVDPSEVGGPRRADLGVKHDERGTDCGDFGWCGLGGPDADGASRRSCGDARHPRGAARCAK